MIVVDAQPPSNTIERSATAGPDLCNPVGTTDMISSFAAIGEMARPANK
jgi:hypothetical protein